MKKSILWLVILFLFAASGFAKIEEQNHQDVSLDLQDVNLSDALQTIAKNDSS